MRTFWQNAQHVLHQIGDFQARLLLTLLYGLLILPVGMALRLSEDGLNMHARKNNGSYWQPLKVIDEDLRQARRQG